MMYLMCCRVIVNERFPENCSETLVGNERKISETSAIKQEELTS